MRCSSHAFLWATNLDLHTQHIPHGLCGFLLCRGGDMGIGVQGETCGEVAQQKEFVREQVLAIFDKKG